MPKIRSPAWLRANGSLEPGGPSRNQWGSCFNRAKAWIFILVLKNMVLYGCFMWCSYGFMYFFFGVNMVLIGFYLFLKCVFWSFIYGNMYENAPQWAMTVSGSLNHHSAQPQQCPPKKKNYWPHFQTNPFKLLKHCETMLIELFCTWHRNPIMKPDNRLFPPQWFWTINKSLRDP